MKIYFYFNLQPQTLLCHEMACYLQTQKESYAFAGIVTVKNGPHYNFLCTQTVVRYEHLDVLEELERQALQAPISRARLETWEQRLDIPLWHLVVADRQLGHVFVNGAILPRSDLMDLADHNNIMRYVGYYLDFYEQRLRGFQADAVFIPAMACLPALALAKVAQWLGIPFFRLQPTRVMEHYIISCNNTTDRLPAVEERLAALQASKAQPVLGPQSQAYLASFQTSRPRIPQSSVIMEGRKRQIGQTPWPQLLLNAGRDLLAAFVNVCQHRAARRPLRHKHPFSQWWCKYYEQWELKYQPRFLFDQPCPEEPYIYFPLHLNPEATTMILAPNFVNQAMLIEILAKNIPLTHKLYVKEHPAMWGRRPRHFYQQIKRWPNVRMLAPTVNGFELIRNAQLIIAITGTAGWEAFLLGRPVLTLGHCFYAYLGLSQRCSDLERLGMQVRQLIFDYQPPHPEEHQQQIALVLNAIMECAFAVDERVIWDNIPIAEYGQHQRRTAHIIAQHFVKELERYYQKQESSLASLNAPKRDL